MLSFIERSVARSSGGQVAIHSRRTNVGGPRLHELGALREQGTASVRGLDLALDGVSEGHLGDLGREVGFLCGPVAKDGAEPVWSTCRWRNRGRRVQEGSGSRTSAGEIVCPGRQVRCPGRAASVPELAGQPTVFQDDAERIIYTSSFRRLQGKTQVYPFPSFDYLRTRLTHTIEVANAGRVIATTAANQLSGVRPAGINAQDCGDIVYAACLAHDLGNPPFGHIGEYAIQTWFADKKPFPSSRVF
jgi:hypothetical protein